jgi:hypothetical protein
MQGVPHGMGEYTHLREKDQRVARTYVGRIVNGIEKGLGLLNIVDQVGTMVADWLGEDMRMTGATQTTVTTGKIARYRLVRGVKQGCAITRKASEGISIFRYVDDVPKGVGVEIDVNGVAKLFLMKNSTRAYEGWMMVLVIMIMMMMMMIMIMMMMMMMMVVVVVMVIVIFCCAFGTLF